MATGGGRRCAAPGCGRFVAAGEAWCRRHADGSGGGFGADPFGEGGADGREAAGSPFLERVQAGEYRALGEPGLAETVARAGEPRGLATEIGMVRVALARLLEEEPDAGKFAAGVARLVAVAVQAARAEQSAAGAGADGDVAMLLAALRRAFSTET